MTDLVHTFAGNPLDRGEAIRRDEQAIDALIAHPNSRFLPFHRLKVGTSSEDRLRWLNRDELEGLACEQPVFLGMQDDAPHFAVAVDDADGSYTDCRMVAAYLATVDTGIVAQARAQLDWHRRNRFCAECGNPNAAERGGQIRRCTACGKHIFPRTDPVAIMLIIDEPGGDRCLLGQSQGRMAQSNFYSALAGFLDQGESLEEAVRREVWEEAGIEVGPVQYHSSQPWPFPSQLMIGCHGIATSRDIVIDEVEMASVEWFTRAEVLAALDGSNERLRVPGAMAIAHHLISAWAHGEVQL